MRNEHPIRASITTMGTSSKSLGSGHNPSPRLLAPNGRNDLAPLVGDPMSPSEIADLINLVVRMAIIATGMWCAYGIGVADGKEKVFKELLTILREDLSK